VVLAGPPGLPDAQGGLTGCLTGEVKRSQRGWEWETRWTSVLGLQRPFIKEVICHCHHQRTRKYMLHPKWHHIPYIANDWNELQKSLKLETHISLTSFKYRCQSTSRITAPVHSLSVNSPSSYLIPILLSLKKNFAPLHPSISTITLIFCSSITPVFNCYIVIILPLWPIYCLTPVILPHLHTLYIYFFYCIIDCMFVNSCHGHWKNWTTVQRGERTFSLLEWKDAEQNNKHYKTNLEAKGYVP
jgi:hypothetical protein